ncbi:hypothetical protein JHK85_005039 [Glycine max]|nr:hypothetical protein JHK85_005039 [Glycine max]KAG5080809.1 hypothetical protein JHK86_004874 [Glycine max]
MPFCGCSIGVVDGCIYALEGFSRSSTIKYVWQYDPIKNSWAEASPMSVGRAYCKTGILNNKLYVVGGVTRGRGGLIPLQSAEVYDPHTCMWSLLPSMHFARAQVLPTVVLADLLKPIAGFIQRKVILYDPNLNSWLEMPIDMGEGWPARQAGTKSSVTVDDDLYALDPSNSVDSAKIKVCDYEGDTWKVAAGDVPIHDFTELESTYLFTRLLEKLHVITKDANHNIMVLQDDMQNEHVESAFSQ